MRSNKSYSLYGTLLVTLAIITNGAVVKENMSASGQEGQGKVNPAPTSAAVTSVIGAEYVINMTSLLGRQILPQTMVNHPRTAGSPVTQAVIDALTESCIFPQDNMFLRRLAYVVSNDGKTAYANSNDDGGIWAVDQAMLKATQADTSVLRRLRQAILDRFGIDWMQVQITDLLKPIYSGIAAALYISIQSIPVPSGAVEQGAFVQNHYKPTTTGYQYSTTVTQNLVPPCENKQQADIAFLLDATVSDQDFNLMRQYLAAVLNCPLNSSTTCPLSLTPEKIRVTIYQYYDQDVRMTVPFDSFLLHEMNKVAGRIYKFTKDRTPADIGHAVSLVVRHAFGSNRNPLSAKMVILVTGQSSTSNLTLHQAEREAMSSGVTVMAVQVGQNNSDVLHKVVTAPDCRHRIVVDDFNSLADYVALTQWAICTEPLMARGMVHCNFNECRNIQFPMTSAETTLNVNVTCDEGSVFVSSRTPRPDIGFYDYRAHVGSTIAIPTEIGVVDQLPNKYIYAQFFPDYQANPNCVVTFGTVDGIIPRPKPPQVCTDQWKYPSTNPCQIKNRTKNRFAYGPNPGMFIQCDYSNQMYLTECPPGYPFFNENCETCMGGSQSPAIVGNSCGTPVNSGTSHNNGSQLFCGRGSNPCTRDHIQANLLYWDCPIDETTYIQCNVWGHAFIRKCQDRFVWRQESVNCEFEPLLQNLCQPNVRYYEYAPDHHYYIDCSTDRIPHIRQCPSNLIWDNSAQICTYDQQPTNMPPIYNPGSTLQPPTGPPNNNNGIVTLPSNSNSLRPLQAISSQYQPPCTKENITNLNLYHPYPQNVHWYIQCDLWGDAYVRACQAGYCYDHFSHTCVDYCVIINN